MSILKSTRLIQILFTLNTFQQILSREDGYLRYVKDGCFIRGEALSCVKYKALKIAKKTFFGDNFYGNETIRANQMISFVPLDAETVEESSVRDEGDILSEPRGFFSEWTEVIKYGMKLTKEFFRIRGLRVDLPAGARAIDDEDHGDARGKKKKLAVVMPLLALMAAVKTKLLLIPVLLAVLLIKKILLIAALLIPGLLSTLKACKHHHPSNHYSYFGSADSSDFSSDYGNSYSYSSGGGYGKDWAANRAYIVPKYRPTPAPTYITAPGAIV